MIKIIAPHKILLVLIVMVLLLSITFAVARAYNAVTDHKVHYKTIQEALSIKTTNWSMARWNLDNKPIGRALGAGDAYMIGQAYTRSMQTLTAATSSGLIADLKKHFTGNAYDRAIKAVADANQDYHMIVMAADAEASLFHLDGSLIQLETKDVITARFSEKAEGGPIYLSKECQKVSLLNQTSGWRVASLERICAKPIETKPAPALSMPAPLVGINYYPKDKPWHDFWPKLTTMDLDKDFQRIQRLGGNAIRIFLQFDPFSETDQLESSLVKLIDLLDIAHDHGLTVIPTLFDLRSEYRPKTWAESWNYMYRVLKAIGPHPSVKIIDIKNEPDRDFEAHGKRRVLAWLETMARLGRMTAPHIAFTVGWAEPQYAPLLEPELGVLTYHDYLDPATMADRLQALQERFPKKPVLITEIGWHSWSPHPRVGMPSSEAIQAEILARQIHALEASDGFFIWTLHDFTNVPDIVVGPLPWRKAMQKSFGLLRQDGSFKPSGLVLLKRPPAKQHPFKLPSSIIQLEQLNP